MPPLLAARNQAEFSGVRWHFSTGELTKKRRRKRVFNMLKMFEPLKMVESSEPTFGIESMGGSGLGIPKLNNHLYTKMMINQDLFSDKTGSGEAFAIRNYGF